MTACERRRQRRSDLQRRPAASLVKGGPLYGRLGFLAAYLLRDKIITRPVELDDAMDMSLIAEVLKGRKPP